MQPNNLQLKVESPVILLRYLNPPWLCNGTRLIIKKIMKNVIEAIILIGKFQGENLLLPWISIVSTDVPIQLKHLQFPIILAFAMAINKSQGQTMSVCDLDLSISFFFIRTIMRAVISSGQTIQFVCVSYRWDNEKYYTLCCIKRFILF